MAIARFVGCGGSSEAQQVRALAVEELEEMQAEQRMALVIGNGDYANAPLRNPPNDAVAMAAALRACGFNVIEKSV